ncbi:hypothetical protein BU17DRAFT_66249 [Hysterangium stoloniferum]|nr:hypothetical protein BU17DRAFT_66249 [Hysterangium stoloniferum]
MAAQKVGAYDDRYKGLKRQSYWFSDMITRVLDNVYKFTAWINLLQSIFTNTEGESRRMYGVVSVQRRPKSKDVVLLAEGFLEECENTISELEHVVTLSSLKQWGNSAWWTLKQRIEF